MKFSLIVFLVISPLIFSEICIAQMWNPIISTDSDVAYFIDPSSIVRSGGVVTYTQLINYSSADTLASSDIRSIKQVKQIDCEKDSIKTISMIGYDRQNALGDILIVSVGQNYKWTQINKGSISNRYHEVVCI